MIECLEKQYIYIIFIFESIICIGIKFFSSITTIPLLLITITDYSTSSSSSGSTNGGGLHCIVLGVLKQVDNLRSAVAKNALLTLGDLFQGLGKSMDQEVGLALSYVLKVG